MTRGWTSLFGFGGELDRRGFALRAATAFVAYIITGVLIFTPLAFGVAVLSQRGSISPELAAPLRSLTLSGAVVLATLPYMWVLTALGARRARNAGLNPYVAMIGWWALSPSLYFLSKLAGGSGASLMLLSKIANTGGLCLLLALPPKATTSARFEMIRSAPPPIGSRTTFGLKRQA